MMERPREKIEKNWAGILQSRPDCGVALLNCPCPVAVTPKREVPPNLQLDSANMMQKPDECNSPVAEHGAPTVNQH